MAPPDDRPPSPGRASGAGRDLVRALDPDYEAILAAVTETARGRWFLDEYARRNRTADTRLLLSALNRLEQSIGRPPGLPPSEVSGRLAGLLELVGQARVEIAAVPHYDDGAVRRAAEAVDFPTEWEPGKAAMLRAHEAAERIQEIVWNLRERQVSAELCDILDRHAVDIQGACRAGTATLKGMSAMGRALRLLECRLSEMIDNLAASGAEPAPPPDIFADDPAVGRFLDDIEMVHVEELDWSGVPHEDASGGEEPDFPQPGGPVPADAPAEDDRAGREEEAVAPPQALAAAPVPLEEPADGASVAMEEARSAEEQEVAGEPVSDPDPADEDRGAPAQPLVFKAPPVPAPAPPGRTEPPADLTGLTFDQKMILFS